MSFLVEKKVKWCTGSKLVPNQKKTKTNKFYFNFLHMVCKFQKYPFTNEKVRVFGTTSVYAPQNGF